MPPFISHTARNEWWEPYVQNNLEVLYHAHVENPGYSTAELRSRWASSLYIAADVNRLIDYLILHEGRIAKLEERTKQNTKDNKR
jgi:hypothetical protein